MGQNGSSRTAPRKARLEVLGLAHAGKSRIKQACSMHASVARKSPVWWPAILVVLAAWATGMLLFDRVTWQDWTQPHWFEGDPLEVYARVKIASEQPWPSLVGFTQVDRLGAPIGADWSAYPVPDKLVFAGTGALARITGLFAAVQLVSAGFFALNALSFYLTARWLRRRWEWALALALVFASCNYNVRWGITLSLGQTFTLPPLVLLCARAARRSAAPAPTRGWYVLAVTLGLWLGLGNPYLAFFGGIVGGGALVLALFRRSPWLRLAPLMFFLGSLTLFFLVANAAYAWQLSHDSGRDALVRNMGDFAVYALRPIDWFVPPADHRISFMARLGHAYLAARHGAGEFFYNYLGVLGLTGFFWLLVTSIRQFASKRLGRHDALFGLVWITAFGVYGGLNTWLGAAGLNLFRASTRIGIFAVVWVLLFLCGRLARVTHRLARPVAVALAFVVAGLAFWEQTPVLSDRTAREQNAARWSLYRDFTDSLEQSLPAAAIFQLPTVPFPEAGRTITMADYEHFLPYLSSHSLRFSYGYLRSAPAARWVRSVSRQSTPEMVAALEQAGFSALWLDQRGLPDRGASLATAMHALSREELPVPAGLPVRVFRLRPAHPAVLPDFADPRLQDSWGDAPLSPGQPQLLALSGWDGLEKDHDLYWRWARKNARIGIWWDGLSRPALLSFVTAGKPGNTVILRIKGREIWRERLGAAVSAPQPIEISLQSGLTTLDWEMVGPTFRPPGNDPRQLGFMIENLAVSVP